MSDPHSRPHESPQLRAMSQPGTTDPTASPELRAMTDPTASPELRAMSEPDTTADPTASPELRAMSGPSTGDTQ